MIDFWKEQAEINHDILQVKDLIEKTLKTSSESMIPIIEHLITKEGKYLRAGIAILNAKVGESRGEIINVAAALELLHLATLIHDDIIDDAEFRRKEKSVQSKFGKDVAVYTGDFILIRAYQLIADTNPSYFTTLARVMEKICIGEIMQNENRYNLNLSTKEYFKIISGKTAALFAMCAYAGAKIGNLVEEDARNLTKAAKYMGMAFQILDDCSDYESDFKNLKKDPLNDIYRGVYTLPLIFYKRNCGNHASILIEEKNLSIEECEAIAESIRNSNALQLSKNIAKRYLKKSIEALNKLEKNKFLEILKSLYLGLCDGV